MIKNLLNADEEPPPGTKVIIEDSVLNPPAETPNAENPATPPGFEVPEDAQLSMKPSETVEETAPLDEESESEAALMAELENLEPEDLEFLEKERETATVAEPVIEQTATEKTPEKTVESAPTGTLFQSDYTPPSTGESIRQSGLAYSAAIVLFGSVIFMMIFGWFADLLLGSSPWGIVGGIILGGLIGFIQLFRITSQIFKK